LKFLSKTNGAAVVVAVYDEPKYGLNAPGTVVNFSLTARGKPSPVAGWRLTGVGGAPGRDKDCPSEMRRKLVAIEAIENPNVPTAQALEVDEARRELDAGFGR